MTSTPLNTVTAGLRRPLRALREGRPGHGFGLPASETSLWRRPVVSHRQLKHVGDSLSKSNLRSGSHRNRRGDLLGCDKILPTHNYAKNLTVSTHGSRHGSRKIPTEVEENNIAIAAAMSTSRPSTALRVKTTDTTHTRTVTLTYETPARHEHGMGFPKQRRKLLCRGNVCKFASREDPYLRNFSSREYFG